MKCTVNVKKLPPDIIDKLNAKLQMIKAVQSAQEQLREQLSARWDELYVELQPAAEHVVNSIKASNAKSRTLLSRIKRALLLQSDPYVTIPDLIYDIANHEMYGVSYLAFSRNINLVIDNYSHMFDEADEQAPAPSSHKLQEMKHIARRFRKSIDVTNCIKTPGDQIAAIVAAAETDYVSAPDITLDQLNTLLTLKEPKQ